MIDLVAIIRRLNLARCYAAAYIPAHVQDSLGDVEPLLTEVERLEDVIVDLETLVATLSRWGPLYNEDYNDGA